MDTIRTYIENVFKSLPQTDEVIRIKTQLLGDMEAKYLELRESGTSEHEAVAKVIGDFGNIDELLEELDLPTPAAQSTATEATPADAERNLPLISMETARDFLAVSKRTSRLVAIGVVLILVGVAEMFVSFAAISLAGQEQLGAIGVILLLLMVIPAVALFIYSGSQGEKYKYIEKGAFRLDEGNKHILAAEFEQKNPRISLAVAIGVGLCIFAAIIIIATAYAGSLTMSPEVILFGGLTLAMLLIAVAVFFFISGGSDKGAYDKILKQGDFAPEHQEANRIVGAIASIYWPVVVCIFLIWGFAFDGWHSAWIVWPIAGVLFGAIAAASNAIKGAD